MYVSPQNMLQFTEHTQRNVLDVVSDRGFTLDMNTMRFMQLAFRHGAHCAGGFAVLVVRHTLAPASVGDFSFDVAVHMNRGKQVLPGNTSSWAGAGKGDIDLFFPSTYAVNAFYADEEVFNLLGMCAWSRTSLLGLAREHYFGQGTEKVQVIVKHVGDIEHQLSSFDIYNAAVAFNGYHMLTPPDWLRLEQARTLHVNRWNGFTVQRVNKYMTRKGYTNLSSKTASEIYDRALEALKESAEMKAKGLDVSVGALPLTSPTRTFGATEPRKIAHRLRPYLSSFTNEQLLELSTLCPQGNYNEAFKTLIGRGESQPHF